MYQLDKEGSLKPEKITLCGHYMLHSGQDSIHLKPPLNLALNTVEVANSSMLKVKKKSKTKNNKTIYETCSAGCRRPLEKAFCEGCYINILMMQHFFVN